MFHSLVLSPAMWKFPLRQYTALDTPWLCYLQICGVYKVCLFFSWWILCFHQHGFPPCLTADPCDKPRGISYSPSPAVSSGLFLCLSSPNVLHSLPCKLMVVSGVCFPQRAVPQVQRPAHLPLSSAPLRALLHLPHRRGESNRTVPCCTTHCWRAKNDLLTIWRL